MPSQRHFTPEPHTAAAIAALSAAVRGDGRAPETDSVRLSEPTQLPPGSYRINGDGSLTLIDEQP